MRWLTYSFFVSLSLLGVKEGLLSQTLFTIPDTAPNYGAYRHMDECIAAVRRTVSEAERQNTLWKDTAEFVQEDLLKGLPEHAVLIGKQCMERVWVDTLSLEHANIWASGLLMADRDVDVALLYRRLLDSVSDRSDVKSFGGFFNDIWSVYRNARPVRVEALESIYSLALQEIPSDSAYWRLFLEFALVELYDVVGSHDRAIEHSYNLLAFADENLLSSIKDPTWRFFIGSELFNILQRLSEEDEGGDSLSSSSDAYRAYLKNLWDQVQAVPFESAVGNTAPVLQGDFWFESKLTKVRTVYSSVHDKYRSIPYVETPVEGKLNLIAFFQAGCHNTTRPLLYGRDNGTPFCWAPLSTIRRIKEMYPDIQVTIVTKTYGNLGDAPPLAPADEADTLAKYFLGFHRIPGTLVVSNTPFFRLAGLDNRRIDAETENDINYTINGQELSRHGSILLVDEVGKIFHYGDITGAEEAKVKKKIAAVLKRIWGSSSN